MDYLDALRGGRMVFNLAISGEEAAKQIGFSRLFASAYEEMLLRAKYRARTVGQVSIQEVIRDFEALVGEEQQIDILFRRREPHAASIAYLRGMQNGDLVFPGPRPTAPIPQALLVRLSTVYPEASFDINDPIFAAIYRKTREFAAARARQEGGVWAYEVIAEFRRLILESASQYHRVQ